MNNLAETIDLNYRPLPTIQKFHDCNSDNRCIVGPVGSGKTLGVSWELFHFLPIFLYKYYGYKQVIWTIVRRTYRELIDTTQATIFAAFPWYSYESGKETMHLKLKVDDTELEVQALFRSCDSAADIGKFKSLEQTGHWIDESIEVPQEAKLMLKGRDGRFPSNDLAKKWWEEKFGKIPDRFWNDKANDYIMPRPRFSIETTNPPDVEHPTYSQFAWDPMPPGPLPTKPPLKNHTGFWQPPYENVYIRPGYYEDLRNDYADNPDWIDMYIEGKPGVLIRGKLVYNNFNRDWHIAIQPLIWNKGTLYRGWDNSGNCPACILLQMPDFRKVQVLKEFTTDKEGIVDFTKRVVVECEQNYPGAKYLDYGDPAGAADYSKREGGFTNNAKLMKDACGIEVISSDQNITARLQAIDQQLSKIDGVLIDSSCTRLINGFLGGYCYKEIGNTGEYSDTIVKNRWSHIHDAFQYVMLRLFHNQKRVEGVGRKTAYQPRRK
jgi:hypothetical protein